MRRTALLLLAASLASLSSAQFQMVTISGRIHDPLTGQGLPGAEIHLNEAIVNDDVRVIADSVSGSFSISFYPLGRYTLRFTAPGRVGAFMIADMSANEYWLGQPTTNWIIAMDLPLQLKSVNGDSADRYLGTCIFLTNKNRPGWREEEADSSYPITANERHGLEQYERYREVLEHKGDIVIRGTVMTHWDRRPLAGVEVRVQNGDGSFMVLHTDSMGFYAVVIPFDRRSFTYSAPGMVSKSVEIDGSSAPLLERIGGYGMLIDIKLFEPIPGTDFSFLPEPMGRATYDREKKNMGWDMDYTQPILDRLNSILAKAGPPHH